MSLLQIMTATASSNTITTIWPGPGSNSPSNTLGTTPGSQGTPAAPGSNAGSVPSPSAAGFIRRGYLGYWAPAGFYTDTNPSIFNGSALDTQVDSYIAFGSQSNMDAYCLEWKGWFSPTSTGDWNFQTQADDVCMLWIGNAAFSPNNSNWTCNNGNNNGLNYNSVSLIQDQWYPIRVRYQEWTGAEATNVYAAPVGGEMIALFNYGYARLGYCTSTDGY